MKELMKLALKRGWKSLFIKDSIARMINADDTVVSYNGCTVNVSNRLGGLVYKISLNDIATEESESITFIDALCSLSNELFYIFNIKMEPVYEVTGRGKQYYFQNTLDPYEVRDCYVELRNELRGDFITNLFKHIVCDTAYSL